MNWWPSLNRDQEEKCYTNDLSFACGVCLIAANECLLLKGNFSEEKKQPRNVGTIHSTVLSLILKVNGTRGEGSKIVNQFLQSVLQVLCKIRIDSVDKYTASAKL